MRKKVILFSLILVICFIPVFADTTLARTTDGSIVILNDDNTYEPFELKENNEPMGYQIGDLMPWDSVTLSDLGNYYPYGNYTMGEFYVLDLKTTDLNATLKTPKLKLSDGTILDGFSKSVSRNTSYSGWNWYKNRQSEVNSTFSVMFNVPRGLKPVSLVLDDQTIALGNYKKL